MPGIKCEHYTPRIFRSDVCKFFKITEEQIKSDSRKTEYRLPRQIFLAYGTRMFKDLTMKEAAKLVNKTHAVVINSRKVVNNMCETDKEFAAKYEEFKQFIARRVYVFENNDILNM